MTPDPPAATESLSDLREIQRLTALVETYQQQNDGLTNGVVRAAELLANRRRKT